jgi:ferredoxin
MRKQYYQNQMRHVMHLDKGYKFEDYAAVSASGYVSGVNNGWLAADGAKGNVGLYSWNNNKRFELIDQVSSDLLPQNPIHLTKITKKVTQLIGASEVGICKLNRKWLFSHNYDPELDQTELLDIPKMYQYAIVIVIEMDQEVLASSPSAWSNISVGLGYSKMAFITGSLAQFIRNFGYNAIPCGNDTALSIPLAIDAGLGQLGRNGLLITPKYGPRVRIAKVLTDMPLKVDKPIQFGVTDVCNQCKKCAKNCKTEAISLQDMTAKGPTYSNNSGVLKWYVDPEKCYKFWNQNGAPCSTCITVCPFNDGVVEEELKKK